MLINKDYKVKTTFFILLFTSFLTGCASYGSRSYSLITPEVRSSTSDKKNVKITISSNVWAGNPENLPAYLTAFYIEIENNSDLPITVQYDDIALIDQFRNQYNALLPDMASNIIVQKSKSKWYFHPSISIGFGSGGYYGGRYRGSYGIGYGGYGYGYPYYRSPFYWPYNYAYYNNYYSGYYDQDYSDLFTRSLVPGVIRPNARISGFVFFKKLPREVNTFELDISYRVESADKQYNLTFPYSVLVY